MNIEDHACLTGDCPHEKQTQCDEELKKFQDSNKIKIEVAKEIDLIEITGFLIDDQKFFIFLKKEGKVEVKKSLYFELMKKHYHLLMGGIMIDMTPSNVVYKAWQRGKNQGIQHGTLHISSKGYRSREEWENSLKDTLPPNITMFEFLGFIDRPYGELKEEWMRRLTT